MDSQNEEHDDLARVDGETLSEHPRTAATVTPSPTAWTKREPPTVAPYVPTPPDTYPQCAGRCFWIWVLPHVLKCTRCGRIKTADR